MHEVQTLVASLLGPESNTSSKLPTINIRFRHSCLFSPGPVGVEVSAGVNVCVGVGVGLGLQVIPPGLGVH